MILCPRCGLGPHNEKCCACGGPAWAKAKREVSASTADLWCVHVLGPDTVIPQPDFWTAAERAAKWSQGMLEMHRRDPSPYDPLMYCNVEPWPWSPESHAEGLAEHGGNPEDIC